MLLHATLALVARLPAVGDGMRSVPAPPFATVEAELSGPFRPPWLGGGESAVACDLDGDGREEVVLSGLPGRLAVVRLGPDGATMEPTFLPALGTPSRVEVADLDGDGAPELVVASSAALQVHWNDGSGGFALPATVMHGTCWVARAGDLNGDGRTDLLASFGPSPLASGGPWRPPMLLPLLGDGQHGFVPAVQQIVWTYGQDLALGDWNEDGRLDAALGRWLDVALFLGDGQGGLSALGTLDGGGETRLVAHDVDADGHLDLLRISSDDGLLSGWLGLGDGTFEAGPSFWPIVAGAPQAPHAIGLDLADLDGDGAADLLVLLDSALALFPGEPQTGFQRGRLLPLPGNGWAGAMADVDGDGALDLVTHSVDYTVEPQPGGFPKGWLGLLRGDGRGGLLGLRQARLDVYSHTGGITVPRAIGDLDGDGFADLVEAFDPLGVLRVHLGDGAGGWKPPQEVATVANVANLRLGDVDGDGRRDLVSDRYGPGGLAVQLGDGSGKLGAPILSAPDAGLSGAELELADLDGDGRSDAVVAEWVGKPLTVYLARGGGHFGTGQPCDGLGYVRAIRAADMDLDGRTDLVVVQSLTAREHARVLLLPGLGDGRFGAARVVRTLEDWEPSVEVGDFDGNGLTDVALTVGSWFDLTAREVEVHLATAPGVLGPIVRSRVGVRPLQLAAGDLDGDGRLDLLVGTPGVRDELLRGRGDGRFLPWGSLGSAGSLSAIADMDRDGHADLIYEWSVVLNQEP